MPGLLQPSRELSWSPSGHLVRARIRSLITGHWNIMELADAHDPQAITRAQYDAWQAGTYIQDAMPQLSDAQREFLMTGATPTEWADEFPTDEED